MSTQQGVVSQVIGPVVDVRFPEGVELPNILDALVVDGDGTKVILETQKPSMRKPLVMLPVQKMVAQLTMLV